jgi:hypothetical protein
MRWLGSFQNALQNILRCHEAGVQTLAGTDVTNPGTAHRISFHRELELVVRAGLPARISMFLRGLIAGLALASVARCGLSAQQELPRRFETGAQLTYVPLYGGDATVGSVSGWGASVSAGMRLTSKARVDVFLTHVPADDDPLDRGPQVQLGGVTVGRTWYGPEMGLFVAGGVGFIAIDTRPRPVCDPPFCFAEGGPSFVDVTLPTVLLSAGYDIPTSAPLRVRTTVRVHMPFGGSRAAAAEGGNLRIEVGLGALYAF